MKRLSQQSKYAVRIWIIAFVATFTTSAVSPLAIAGSCSPPEFDPMHEAYFSEGCADLVRSNYSWGGTPFGSKMRTASPAWMDMIGLSASIDSDSLDVTLYSNKELSTNVLGYGYVHFTLILDLDGDADMIDEPWPLGWCVWEEHGYDAFILIVSNDFVSDDVGYPRVSLLGRYVSPCSRQRLISENPRRYLHSVKGVDYSQIDNQFRVSVPLDLLDVRSSSIGVIALFVLMESSRAMQRSLFTYEMIPDLVPLVVPFNTEETP